MSENRVEGRFNLDFDDRNADWTRVLERRRSKKLKHVIIEKSGTWVQGRFIEAKRVQDPKLGTTNLGEKLTMPDEPISLEELLAHLDRIAKEWDRGRGLEKSHKYIKRTGMPGHYQYWYQTPSGTREAKELGSRMTQDQALKLWEEWHEIQVTPHPKDMIERGKRAIRSQLLRETVEGFLGSEEAMTPEDIDKELSWKVGEEAGALWKMNDDEWRKWKAGKGLSEISAGIREREAGAEAEALKIITGNPNIAFPELSKKMGIAEGRVGGALDRLEKKDLIKKQEAIMAPGGLLPSKYEIA